MRRGERALGLFQSSFLSEGEPIPQREIKNLILAGESLKRDNLNNELVKVKNSVN